MPHTRRSFLSSSLTVAATVCTSGRVLGANDRLNVAVIGVNGMGSFHVRTLAERKDVQLVALCDVDPTPLARVAKTVKDATKTEAALVEEFQKVLDDKIIEAVVVATPHHWHVPIALRALAAGKDVYVEKPASHVFREGRLLIEMAAKHKRIVQHGTQMRSSEVTTKAA
ncbi:MAG: Gfo/Idh/MocA family oxidoreductase, partial [Planctomycetia bacterium]|nr:Gfo/Idh/MocA family oxidoreductase [Planctomycetia bacterium]